MVDYGDGFSILSALAVSLGTVLQKKAHIDDLALPPAQRHRRKAGILFSRMWLCGFLTMLLLQIPLTFVALALAPQSLVIPLGAGCVILTTAANAGVTKTLTACQIVNRYGDADFVAPLIILLLLLMLSTLIIHHEQRVRPKFRPALFAFTAGGLGAVLNVLLKVVGEFSQGALSGWDPSAQDVWSTVHPYYNIVFIALMAVGMISFINQGLERFPAVSFLPLYNCLFIVLSTLLGALFFKEFDDFSVKASIMFPLGICVTIVGISMLSMGMANKTDVDGASSKGIGESDQDGSEDVYEEVELQERRDPIEHVFFDVDTSLDAKAYAKSPAVGRLVLI
ncbi:hypothetical protein BASA81_007956 [Batrachochytrium salamandrivorans]|nr:hypothetical protein BASA81_007956 [Batrachochytrium salamandrivorans]